MHGCVTRNTRAHRKWSDEIILVNFSGSGRTNNSTYYHVWKSSRFPSMQPTKDYNIHSTLHAYMYVINNIVIVIIYSLRLASPTVYNSTGKNDDDKCLFCNVTGKRIQVEKKCWVIPESATNGKTWFAKKKKKREKLRNATIW